MLPAAKSAYFKYIYYCQIAAMSIKNRCNKSFDFIKIPKAYSILDWVICSILIGLYVVWVIFFGLETVDMTTHKDTGD